MGGEQDASGLQQQDRQAFQISPRQAAKHLQVPLSASANDFAVLQNINAQPLDESSEQNLERQDPGELVVPQALHCFSPIATTFLFLQDSLKLPRHPMSLSLLFGLVCWRCRKFHVILCMLPGCLGPQISIANCDPHPTTIPIPIPFLENASHSPQQVTSPTKLVSAMYHCDKAKLSNAAKMVQFGFVQN
jgi:hypothetical protein